MKKILPATINKWHLEIEHPLEFPFLNEFTYDINYLEAGLRNLQVEPLGNIYLVGIIGRNKKEKRLLIKSAFRSTSGSGIIVLCDDDVTYVLGKMLSYEHYYRWWSAYKEFVGDEDEPDEENPSEPITDTERPTA